MTIGRGDLQRCSLTFESSFAANSLGTLSARSGGTLRAWVPALAAMKFAPRKSIFKPTRR